MTCPQCERAIEDSSLCVYCSEQGADPLLGRTLLGRYQIVKRLGSGGSAVVYEARHLSLDCIIALKVLAPDQRHKPEDLARFRREAKALSQLKHPYAVRVYDQGEDDGLWWIAIEHLEGESLADRLSREKFLQEAEAVEVICSALEVLAEAHEKGIYHRDLKPENLMLTRIPNGKGIAKVIDFGMSTLQGADPLTRAKLVSGTPAYMAPEQWEGLRFADAKSDIYSLGVILYQSLSGSLPLEADSPMAWLKKHYAEEPRPLQEVMAGRELSKELCRVVMRALSKDPKGRQESALSFKKELEDAIQNKEHPTITPTGSVVRPTQTKRSLWISFSLLLLAGFWWFAFKNESSKAQTTKPLKATQEEPPKIVESPERIEPTEPHASLLSPTTQEAPSTAPTPKQTEVKLSKAKPEKPQASPSSRPQGKPDVVGGELMSPFPSKEH